MTFLLDTDVCVHLLRNTSTPREPFRRYAKRIGISAVTYAELRFGLERSVRRREAEENLERLCRDLDIVPFDQEAAAHYGKIRQELSRRGELIRPLDLLIAAHARSRDATLVTNNEREFARVPGLRIENWLRPDEPVSDRVEQ